MFFCPYRFFVCLVYGTGRPIGIFANLCFACMSHQTIQFLIEPQTLRGQKELFKLVQRIINNWLLG